MLFIHLFIGGDTPLESGINVKAKDFCKRHLVDDYPYEKEEKEITDELSQEQKDKIKKIADDLKKDDEK